MYNIFLFHGAYGNPEENWFPWLKQKLEDHGFKVEIPSFPTPSRQSLENWLKVFKKYEKNIDEHTIMIGHSIAPAFMLTLLEKIDNPIKAAFFISPFINLLENPEFDVINETFINKDFDWEKIKVHCAHFSIFHSDNDPYVPLEKAQQVAEKLNIKVQVISGAGHFNTSAGYDRFPLLLEEILNMK